MHYCHGDEKPTAALPGQDSGPKGWRARRHWSEAQRPAQLELGKRGAGQWRPLGSPSRARGGLGGGREQPERPRPAAWAPASRGRAAPRRPPPAPPAAAAAAALRANGRWQPACAARRGLAPATRERPRPASPLRGAEVSPLRAGSQCRAAGFRLRATASSPGGPGGRGGAPRVGRENLGYASLGVTVRGRTRVSVSPASTRVLSITLSALVQVRWVSEMEPWRFVPPRIRVCHADILIT